MGVGVRIDVRIDMSGRRADGDVRHGLKPKRERYLAVGVDAVSHAMILITTVVAAHTSGHALRGEFMIPSLRGRRTAVRPRAGRMWLRTASASIAVLQLITRDRIQLLPWDQHYLRSSHGQYYSGLQHGQHHPHGQHLFSIVAWPTLHMANTIQYCNMASTILMANSHNSVGHNYKGHNCIPCLAASCTAFGVPFEQSPPSLWINDAGHRSYHCGLAMLATVHIIVD